MNALGSGGVVRGFCIVALIGIALRVAVTVATGAHVPPYDGESYLTLAQHLRSGTGLWIDNAAYGSNLRALFPPLYPVLLALVGASAWSAVLLNSAFDVGTALLIYRIGKDNLLAPAMFLLCPTIVLNAATPQKESLCVLFVAALVYSFLNWRPIVFGLMAGLLALTQPALVAFPAILCLMRPIREWRGIAISAGAGLLTISPWVIRNALVLHAFVPLTTAAGFSLAFVVHNNKHIPLDQAIRAMPEVARSAVAGKEAVEAISTHIGAYLFLVARNVLKAFTSDGYAAWRLHWERFGEVSTAVYAILVGCSAIGLRLFPPLRKIAIASGLTFLTMIWFEFGERHRYFLYPMLAIAAAKALQLARKPAELKRPIDTYDRSGFEISR